MDSREIGLRIQTAMAARGWKLRHLRQALNQIGRDASIQSLSQWQTGDRENWGYNDDLDLLTRALGTPPDYFTADPPYTVAQVRSAITLRKGTCFALVKIGDAIFLREVPPHSKGRGGRSTILPRALLKRCDLAGVLVATETHRRKKQR